MSRPAVEEYLDKGRIYCGYDDAEQEKLSIARYQFSLNFIKEGDVCLDAACGSGYGSVLISQKAKEVVGLEIDDHALNFAREHYQNEKVSFRKADLTQRLGLPSNYFDVIVSIETIEHISAHDAMLGEFRRVLKPGGLLVLSTVEHEVYSERGGIRNKFHIGELTKEELLALISKYFKLEELYGYIKYVPLSWNKRLSQKLWLLFLTALGKIDILRLRYAIVKRFHLSSTVDAVNKGLSTMKITDIEKTDFGDRNDYYQLIVVASKT